MKILDKIIEYGLYLLVFLTPIINKQILLAVFVFLLLSLWMIKIIISGKVNLNWGKLSSAVLLFLIIIGICAFFSSAKIQSFWGMDFNPDTVFSFILYAIVFFLFANLVKKESFLPVLRSFLASASVLSILFLIQIFKPELNLVGSIQALGVLLGGAFIVLLALISSRQMSKKISKVSAVLIGLLLFSVIFLINFWVVWLGIAFGSLIIIFKGLKNISKETSATNPLKPIFLPVSIFVVALVLIFLKLPIANIVHLPLEVSPTYQATLDIASKTIKETPKNLILGSGPATFGYQYSLHRGIGSNFGNFWQIRFDQGNNVVLTLLATLGILGVLSILAIIALFFFQGLFSKNIAIFAGGAYFLVLWFLYSGTASLYFFAFLMLGLLAVSSGSKIKEFSFTQSPQKSFFIMLICIVFIVGSILGIYNISKKYVADRIYNQGINLINAKEQKLDQGIIKINKATMLDPKDFYFRNLSQAFLLKINEIINSQVSSTSQEQKQAAFQSQVSNAEVSASNAVKINPKNSQNWLQLGIIYENFALINVQGASDLAIANYQKASGLDPQNPLIPFSIARTYFTDGKKEEAKKELEKALQLKSDFQPAIDLLAQ